MSELTVASMLRRTLRLFADRPAVVDLATGHRATYAEHADRVQRACGALASLGVGPDDRFGVLAGNGHVYVELWHAALSGAGVINPVNTRLAPDELVYILADSGTRVLLVDSTFAPVVAGLRDRLPALDAVVLLDDGDGPADQRWSDLTAAPGAWPAEPGEDAAAVLMYTGGTTGLPKGVVLTHRAVALVIYRMVHACRFPPRTRFLVITPLFHVAGIPAWGLMLPDGGCVFIQRAFEPGGALAALRDYGITATGAVPTMLAMLLRHPTFDPAALASLELVMYGASAMPPELLDAWFALRPGIDFVQVYGMTECGATATALVADDHRTAGPRLRSVGRPVLGVEIEIRDPVTGEPTPPGEVGEVWLRCDSLLREYWAKPEQTAAALVDGWYRSGDAGRLDDEGYLFLADRVKDMIVTGGENVYSLEVEHAISSHPAVVQVAVIGVPDALWGERVHAVVVLERDDTVTGDELAAHARSTIAGYKVPKSFTFQTEPLPLSAAAKVLKRELRERVVATSGA